MYLLISRHERIGMMIFPGIIPFAHELLSKAVKAGDVAVDATCGNGNDTLYLSTLVGEKGHVYGFDIQEQAIFNTKALLEKNERKNCTLIHDSHALADKYIEESIQISAAIFNLGYLPRSDKRIITKPESTLIAVEKLLYLLKQNGVLILVVYAGHPGGSEEKEAIIQFAASLDPKAFTVLRYQLLNMKKEPPFVVAIEKK